MWSQALKSTYIYIQTLSEAAKQRGKWSKYSHPHLCENFNSVIQIVFHSVACLCACSLFFFFLVWLFTKVCTFVLTISCYIFNPLYSGGQLLSIFFLLWAILSNNYFFLHFFSSLWLEAIFWLITIRRSASFVCLLHMFSPFSILLVLLYIKTHKH